MGSKKHKKESKKKKHRSRSRSPLDGEARERKRHRKHKDRKKDRSPDVEEVPVDSHLVEKNGSEKERSRSTSTDRDRRLREERHKRLERERTDKSEDRSSPQEQHTATNANNESLSIEETNRLRAKLGLKPLEVTETHADDGKIKDDLGEFYHKPAENISKQKQTEKIREKLHERKEKRKIEQKLKTTLLAEGSDDEDTTAWVQKNREIQKQKEEAAKRAAMLDEMDEVFGVGALVADEAAHERSASYQAAHLKGLRVAHDLRSLDEERDVILTLADKEILAEDAEDVLVNVNIVDNEKSKKNIEERKKAKMGYQAYDDEEDIEMAAMGYKKSVLSKYDEEIEKGKADKSRGFVIGDEDQLEAIRFKEMMRARHQNTVEKRLESLQLPQLRIASDYMNEEEVETKFKKSKRKGKIRKRPKNEPIDVDSYDPNTAALETDDTEIKPDLFKTELAVDEEEVEPDSELQTALARARRLRQEEASRKVPKMEEILGHIKNEPATDEPVGGSMVLDATAEFCRTLGDIPTYGLAGNRDQQAEIMDFEREDMEVDAAEEGADAASSAWSRVDVYNEKPPDVLPGGSGLGASGSGGAGVLAAEPALGAGVAGALQLALSKGYLERSQAPPTRAPPRHAHLLAAHHYSIEDKAHGEDDKHGRRERGYAGPLQDFREKWNFKPNIKLEYVDDDGRPLCPKEAFRYLSHKFHGKGPGKNKQEKRIKKAVQEGLMKKMSSTDTPLGTLALLQEKQKETHSPFIVLSGTKKESK